MTIGEILKIGSKKLKSSLDAEVLLSHTLDKPKEYLFSNPEKQLRPNHEKKYYELLARRQIGWPVAYLTGQKEFFGNKLAVDQRVLIPRPETETLVELVLSKTKAEKRRLKILDLGTGSGNIIISLAKQLGSSNSYLASDASQRALVVAKKNARKQKVKIIFKQGNLLEPWKDQKFDVIIANLPYGWKQWKNNTSAETIGLKFEPKNALFTTKNGLALYDKLLGQIARRKSSAEIWIEFDPRQTDQLKKLIKKHLLNASVTIHKDLTHRNRFAHLEIKTAA